MHTVVSATTRPREFENFREATRSLTSVLAPIEKRTLIWLAHRMPGWVNSDHLTGLALVAMLLAGLAYWLASVTPVGLLLVVVCLAVNWFGDSLDGTLARVRRHQRPRYGFYVDHLVDAFGALFLLCGLGLSGYMSPLVAVALLVAYLLLLIETFLATYSLRTFKMSYFKIGPTELRILLAIGNLVLLVHPMAGVFGREYRLFDVGGAVAACGMLATLAFAAVTNTRALYVAEPLPGRADRR
jgi:phosphatidylglycerophosphate synthase